MFVRKAVGQLGCTRKNGGSVSFGDPVKVIITRCSSRVQVARLQA